MDRVRPLAIVARIGQLALIVATVVSGTLHARIPCAPLDMYDVASFGSLSGAPDGGHVFWTRSRFDFWSDRGRTQLWIATVTAKGVALRLLVESANKPGGVL